MRHGFIKVAAATPDIRVADVDYNKGQIIKQMDEAAEAGAKIIVFPELCITGYTCSDLFLQDILLNSAKKALVEIAEQKIWMRLCLWESLLQLAGNFIM